MSTTKESAHNYLAQLAIDLSNIEVFDSGDKSKKLYERFFVKRKAESDGAMSLYQFLGNAIDLEPNILSDAALQLEHPNQDFYVCDDDKPIKLRRLKHDKIQKINHLKKQFEDYCKEFPWRKDKIKELQNKTANDIQAEINSYHDALKPWAKNFITEQNKKITSEIEKILKDYDNNFKKNKPKNLEDELLYEIECLQTLHKKLDAFVKKNEHQIIYYAERYNSKIERQRVLLGMCLPAFVLNFQGKGRQCFTADLLKKQARGQKIGMLVNAISLQNPSLAKKFKLVAEAQLEKPKGEEGFYDYYVVNPNNTLSEMLKKMENQKTKDLPCLFETGDKFYKGEEAIYQAITTCPNIRIDDLNALFSITFKKNGTLTKIDKTKIAAAVLNSLQERKDLTLAELSQFFVELNTFVDASNTKLNFKKAKEILDKEFNAKNGKLSQELQNLIASAEVINQNLKKMSNLILKSGQQEMNSHEQLNLYKELDKNLKLFESTNSNYEILKQNLQLLQNHPSFKGVYDSYIKKLNLSAKHEELVKSVSFQIGLYNAKDMNVSSLEQRIRNNIERLENQITIEAEEAKIKADEAARKHQRAEPLSIAERLSSVEKEEKRQMGIEMVPLAHKSPATSPAIPHPTPTHDILHDTHEIHISHETATSDANQIKTIYSKKLPPFCHDIIMELDKYINKIKDYKKSGSNEIDFASGFWVLAEDRARNRKINYHIALALRERIKELNEKLPEIALNQAIEKLFSDNSLQQVSDEVSLQITHTHSHHTIRSDDLNTVLYHARELSKHQDPMYKKGEEDEEGEGEGESTKPRE